MRAIEYVRDPIAWRMEETFGLVGFVAALSLSGAVFRSERNGHSMLFDHGGKTYRIPQGSYYGLDVFEFSGGTWDWTATVKEEVQTATVARAVGLLVWCDQLEGLS